MTVTVSAGDLSEFCFPEGSLGVMPTVERMHEGTSAHKKLQNIYKENESIKYEREVPLEITVTYGEVTLKIQGRADGIFTDKTNWFIHEIKSTYCAHHTIEKPLKRQHKAQMMIYAYIYAKELNIAEIKGRLSYFCLSDDQIVDFEYTFDYGALENAFNQMAEQYALFIKKQLDAQKALKETASHLKFPFPSFRKGQREGAKQIYSAIIKSKNLFLQAPTGTGKTVMALFPAIKHLKDEDARIFCLSAKNQTMSVTEQALKLMREQGLKIKTCTITAKAKCCFKEIQDCTPEGCEYSLDYYPKLHNALPEIMEIDDYSAENILMLAEKYKLCPYELSLELALLSSVIICDYNYLFDPVVYLKRFFDENGNYIFLIDEAHNLIERARDMFSLTLEQKRLREIKKLFAKDDPLYRSFGKILTELNKLIKHYAENGEADDISKLFYAIMNNGDAINKRSQVFKVPNDAVLFQKELVRLSTLWEYYNEEDFRLYFTSSALVLECIDPSKMLEESIKKGFSSIFYSATLSPYEFYKNSILPSSEAFGYMTEYPFPKENLTVLADYTVDTRYVNREKYYSIIAEKLDKYFSYTKGNVMVYFPSYNFMEEVRVFTKSDVLLQKSESDSETRKEFLDAFKPEGKIMGFAVMGSHFGEGIDIKNLDGIIIVGVALPKFNEARKHIEEHFQKKYQKGFEYAYVYPGINKVCQASGRLIRGESDKGFIILMDNRFRTYRELLPPHWNVKIISSDDDVKKHLID
ncbi:MAG: DEAD/DEAH box helicase [Clostridia bacterium]|nr:DEAD/DEAH box helicase [Clostridia bacterium]